MTKPVLHVPQKDSPQSSLAVGINDTETVLELDDSSIFEGDSVTRLTLGIDQSVTEIVTISTYDGDNEITVVRGTPAYSWPSGTLVARVLNSEDIEDIHEYLEYLDDILTGGALVTNGDSHNHSGGDGAQIPEGGLQDSAVTENKIASNAVTAAKIGTGAVTAGKIGADAIDGTKIADNAINSEHIYAGSIDTAHIADSQITATKLASSAVIEAKIASGAVTEAKLGSGAVTEAKLGSGAVTEAKLGFPYISKNAEGRLTLQSGVPFGITDQTDKTVLYYTPYIGNTILLYVSGSWKYRTFSEISLTISSFTASKPHDIWIYDNSGTPTLDATVWTSLTARATALTYQDGILVKNGDPTRRYLGTIYVTSGKKCSDSALARYVWNMYNRELKMMYKRSDTASDIYFIIGDPNGQFIKFGAGATFNGDGSCMMYLRSTVEPSGSAPYTSEAGTQITSNILVGTSQTEVGAFPTGFSYIGWDKGGAGTLDYGHIWGEFWG